METTGLKMKTKLDVEDCHIVHKMSTYSDDSGQWITVSQCPKLLLV